MNITIRGISDSKDHDKERLILDVKSDEDIGKYLVLDTTYNTNGGISNKARHCHWFVDQAVKKGDVVVLYTKQGASSSKINQDGSVTYFFYWGLDSSVWNNDGDCAVLLFVSDWESKAVK